MAIGAVNKEDCVTYIFVNNFNMFFLHTLCISIKIKFIIYM